TLMSEPRDEDEGEEQPTDCSRGGENKAFGEELADDPATTSAQSPAHGELLAARGGAGEQQIREVHACDQQDHSDGGPQNNQRSVETTTDVVFERDGNDTVVVRAARFWILEIPAERRCNSRRVADSLRQRNARLQPPDHGDDVAPVAGRPVEIERLHGIDLRSRGEDGTKVEGRR